MSAEETLTQESQTPEVAPEPTKVEAKEAEAASFGKPQQAKFNIEDYSDILNKDPDSEQAQEQVAPEKKEETAKAESTEQKTNKEDLSEDQIKAYFEKQGVTYNGIDDLKSKLSPEDVISPEELKKQQLEAERKYVDVVVNGGGTVEEYVQMKSLAEKPLNELSLELLKAELSLEGLSEEEVKNYIKDSFYQFTDEELEDLSEDEKQSFLKLKAIGSKRLESYASNIQKEAKNALDKIKNIVESEKLVQQEQEQISSKVDEYFSNLTKKLTFNLGESNGKPQEPLEFEISDKQIAEARDFLKDPDKREQFLTNSDGTLNIENISNLKLENIYLKSLVKVAFLEGGSRQAKIVSDIFPAVNPYAVGVGESNKQKFIKGQPASFGKPKVVSPQFNN